MKTALVCKPILSMYTYSPDAYTALHADACKDGIGVVLLEKQKDS